MKLEYDLYSVEEFMPANKRWVIIKCNSGVRVAYYEDGSFWDTAGSKASGFICTTHWSYV